MSTPSCSPPADGGGARCTSPTASRRKASPSRSGGSARKSSGSKEFGCSILNSVNKSTSQFKKSMNRRSGSPIDWFPRKKTESYLKRKIKRLQETGGMTASLHETLGNANPHYTRMAREKIAAKEAARKAMEARKDAMVEASWCRILQAARIQNKEAEEVMEKAKLRAAQAFEEARVIGVMMYDRPDCQNLQHEVESSSHTGGQSTHKVTASFQTGFEVDMEVAAAVKKAFVLLANSPDSSEKEEFKELIWKISQNPDGTEADVNSEAEQQLGDCVNDETKNLMFSDESFRTSIFPSDSNTSNVQQSTDLVSSLLERLKSLHEDELASLAVIVATSGLNAALQRDRCKYHGTQSLNNIAARSHISQSRRYSTAASFVDIQGPKKEFTPELPTLDKFLVKHFSKLEREVQEARVRKETSARSVAKGTQDQLAGNNSKSPEAASDLGSILVKHVSKLEKEILEAKRNQHIHSLQASKQSSELYKAQSESLCHSGSKWNCDSTGSGEEGNVIQGFSDCSQENKENKIIISHQLPPSGAKGNQVGKRLNRIEAAKLEALKAFYTKDGDTLDVGLEKIFVKPIHRLEKEKKKAFEQEQTTMQNNPHKHVQTTVVAGNLDDILVKHVSRLEREKMEFVKRNEMGDRRNNLSNDQRKHGNNITASESLDQVLVKHVSRLEREKMEYRKRNSVAEEHTNVPPDQKHGNNVTASESLDEVLVNHVSRLEREKVEYEKSKAIEEGQTSVPHDRPKHGNNAGATSESLDQVLVKHVSRLEREKVEYEERNALGEERTDVQNGQQNLSNSATESESLDQILVRDVSTLEKDKMENEKKSDMIFTKKGDTQCTDGGAGSLADIFVKRPTMLEQAKLAAAAADKRSTSSLNPVEERRRAREKELLNAWGGLGLGNSMKPHVSKIEKDKASWRKAEQEQKQMRAVSGL